MVFAKQPCLQKGVSEHKPTRNHASDLPVGRATTDGPKGMYSRSPAALNLKHMKLLSVFLASPKDMDSILRALVVASTLQSSVHSQDGPTALDTGSISRGVTLPVRFLAKWRLQRAI